MIKNIKKAGNFFCFFHVDSVYIKIPAFLIKMLKKAGKNHYT